MATDLYRGYEIHQNTEVGTFEWTDEDNNIHDGFDIADKAMDAIDAYKRAAFAAK